MLKKSSFRKIAIATCALIIVGLLYVFPTKNNNYLTKQQYVNVQNKKCDIFLIDENNYVAMTNIPINYNDSLKKAKEILETLTINGTKKDYIPNGFKAIIPKNTKVLNISLSNNLLKADFSKELLNVEEKNEEKMIEAIVYSLTSIKAIKQVMIFVDGQGLYQLPHSKKVLPPILDRSYGINKEYDINDYKNTTKTTIYYISKFKDNYYYVPVTKINNNHNNKVEIIINELQSTPIYQTNLISYLKTNAKLEDYQLKEHTISLSFDKNLFNDLDKKNILEEVKYTISLSLQDNLDIKEVDFLVDSKPIDKVIFN